MSRQGRDEWIVVTEDAKTLPVIEVLTGRGFITGKSGSGKSNSASVIAEELLSNGYNLLIVDTEGEYFGLKEEYELLHVGGDDFADVEVGPGHAEKIAEIAIHRNMPVILDVSGYFEASDARELIAAVLEEIYHLEKDARKPFLVMVEEMQEYLPQQGGATDLAALLERIAKRGRKRGLGICGMSQRPSSVDKDFITQCDWMVWHRLTWETDLNVVRNILGSERAGEVPEFDPGQGILMTDWDDTIETVQFKRKRTHDAGATPSLESYERPDLQAVGNELIREIKGTGATADLTPPGLSAEAAPESVERSDPEETVEPEGDTEPELDMESELDWDGVEPADTEADVGNGTDLPAAVEEEIDELEPADIADELAGEYRKNQLLESEIEELRAILDGVEGRDSAPTVGPNGDDPVDAMPRPPRPPRRPPDRDGVGGNLIEFGHMVVYLVRSGWYRLRVRYYRHNRARSN